MSYEPVVDGIQHIYEQDGQVIPDWALCGEPVADANVATFSWGNFPLCESCQKLMPNEVGGIGYEPYGPATPKWRGAYGEPMLFVAVYEIDRAFGGSEEGGWWFDTGQLMEQRVVPCHILEATVEQLQAEWPDEDGANVGSVIYRGGCYNVRWDDKPHPEFYPEHQPHYE